MGYTKNEPGNITILSASTHTLIKRAIRFGKTYIVMSCIFSLIAISLSFGVFHSLINAIGISNALPNIGTGISFLEVPFALQAVIMLITPVIILFLYDKSNGVLEYFLSLGMTQRNIYMYYLRGALLTTSFYVVLFTIINLALNFILHRAGNIIAISLILLLVVLLAISVMAFMITSTTIFSSLQKSRAGENQPTGLLVGGFVGVLPSFAFPILFSFRVTFLIEIFQTIAIITAFFSIFLFSGKLVKREKFLP